MITIIITIMTYHHGGRNSANVFMCVGLVTRERGGGLTLFYVGTTIVQIRYNMLNLNVIT